MKFKEIAEAYAVLRDGRQRRRYDLEGFSAVFRGHQGFYDSFQIFQEMFADSFGDDLLRGRFKEVNHTFKNGEREQHVQQSAPSNNRKKVTIISMDKKGEHIEEKYEDGCLVQRTVNGFVEFHIRSTRWMIPPKFAINHDQTISTV